MFAGANNTSYRQAAADATELFELPLTDRQVRRVCKPIGAERCAERDAATEVYESLTLVARKGVPDGVAAPDLAVVGVDGGRLQIIDSDADEPTDDAGEEPANRGRHWREDKVGMMMVMTSDEHESDPCPDVPETFVDPLRILKLSRELKKSGPLEGTNTKIKAMQRQAYGFRDREYCKLKIVDIHKSQYALVG